ncbi:MAG: hypothetical protein M3N25_03320, partial [Actinomycetota bacterium]|nr:hypothetical protein [Actinomycetota bacterium]
VSVVLAHLFERVEALEQAATAAPQQGLQLRLVEELAQRTVDELDQHRARTIERLDELAGSVTALGELPQRVAALEWVEEGTTAIHHALSELGRGLDRLSAVPERVEALERTADEAIDAIEQRLGGMEKAVADLGRGLEDMAAEVARLGELPRRVEALEQADEPASAEALTAVQARLDQLCERADGMEPLPQRVDALERAAFGGGPVHHRSRSMVADLDALEAQVAVVATAVDGVPRRLADVERASARTEALERGLAGAVDMIDQLVAQLAALEWACRPLPPPDEDG